MRESWVSRRRVLANVRSPGCVASARPWRGKFRHAAPSIARMGSGPARHGACCIQSMTQTNNTPEQTLIRKTQRSPDEAARPEQSDAARLHEVLSAFRNVVLMTPSAMQSGGLNGRPMHVASLEDDNDLWFFTRADSDKVREAMESDDAYVVAQDSTRQVVMRGPRLRQQGSRQAAAALVPCRPGLLPGRTGRSRPVSAGLRPLRGRVLGPLRDQVAALRARRRVRVREGRGPTSAR